MNIITYNCGNIGSASAIAYLGAKKRLVSSNGVFLLHRTKPASGNIGHLPIMKAVADGVAIDDARIEAILRESINLTPEQWSVFSQADLTIDAATAVEVGLAHNIGFFSPNGPLYNI